MERGKGKEVDGIRGKEREGEERDGEGRRGEKKERDGEGIEGPVGTTGNQLVL